MLVSFYKKRKLGHTDTQRENCEDREKTAVYKPRREASVETIV